MSTPFSPILLLLYTFSPFAVEAAEFLSGVADHFLTYSTQISYFCYNITLILIVIVSMTLSITNNTSSVFYSK
jgi:hypothetical protein